jgi:hypothetical protein
MHVVTVTELVTIANAIRGKEMINNYDIFTASRLGRYKEGNSDTELATGAHNSVADETEITTDQIREMINELEDVTHNQKQEFTGVLVKYQGREQYKKMALKPYLEEENSSVEGSI